MLPMLSSATHPVKPVLNRLADSSLRLSAPPGWDNHDRQDNRKDGWWSRLWTMIVVRIMIEMSVKVMVRIECESLTKIETRASIELSKRSWRGSRDYRACVNLDVVGIRQLDLQHYNSQLAETHWSLCEENTKWKIPDIAKPYQCLNRLYASSSSSSSQPS